MRKSAFASALLAAAMLCPVGSGIAYARSGGVQLPVEVLPLPAPIVSVTPAQGIVDLDGSSTTGSPLGAASVGVTFSSAPEKNIDIEPGVFIKMYVDGESEPSELLPAEKAVVDAMGFPIGGFTFARKYTKKGIYHIEVPAGVWIVNGQETPAFAINYEIVNDYFITPNPGVVNEISEFEIIFPSSFETTVDPSMIKLYKERSDEDISFTIEAVPPSIDGEEQNIFIIRTGKPITEPYTYVLEMKKGAFKQKWFGPDFSMTQGVRDILSDAQVLRFIIPDVGIPSIMPPTDKPVSYFTNFVLTIEDEGDYVLVPNDKAANFLYPCDEEWTADTAPYARLVAFIPDDEVKGDDRTITLSFYDALRPDGTIDPDFKIVPPPGNYILQLGEGCFSEFKGNAAPLLAAPYTYQYTVIADPTITEIYPKPGVTLQKLETVELRYPNAQYVVNNEEVAQALTLLGENGLPVEGVTVSVQGGGIAPFAADDEYVGAKVVLGIEPPVMEKGNYTLVVPQGYFVCDGDYESLEEQITYSVDGSLGIAGTVVEAADITVYTSTGVCVLKNAAPAALDALAPGIYIVNGKKLVVRK